MNSKHTRHFDYDTPKYFDARMVSGKEIQITNVVALDVVDGFDLVLHCDNGDVGLCLMSCEYVGYGEMEDLKLGIHLPSTIYM